MEVECRVLYKRYGGHYGIYKHWKYSTTVVQLVDFSDVYLEIYSDVPMFRGYAPISFDGKPLEYNILDCNYVRHTIKHGSEVIITLETNNLGTLYRLPLSDDRNLSDPERQVSDEEFNRIVDILHPIKVDYCENRKVRTN